MRWYLELSKRPLQILIFLAPLIIAYELGTFRFATDPETGRVITISAYGFLDRFFEIFGVNALYLPGLTLIVVLLVWHLLVKDRWEVHAGVPALMWIESLALSLPLLVLNQIVLRLFADGSPILFGLALQADGGSGLAELDWPARLVLSIGAGVYEELVFRMLVIAAVHALIVDVLKASDSLGTAIAIVVSALAFMVYHPLNPDGAGVRLHLATFYLLAGLYFGVVYVGRGFGVVVGAHAVYDVLVLVVLPRATG